MISEIEPVDLHVGNRMRTQRRFLGLSQSDLANACGITFQQIQKYERGANRVSASRLVQIARIFGVTPGWFFIGLDGMPAAADPLADGEAARIAVAQEYDVAVLLDALAAMSHGERKALLRLFAVSIEITRDLVTATHRRRPLGVRVITTAERVRA